MGLMVELQVEPPRPGLKKNYCLMTIIQDSFLWTKVQNMGSVYYYAKVEAVSRLGSGKQVSKSLSWHPYQYDG